MEGSLKFIPTALHELYKHRTLLRTLISREIRQRYRGTALGLLWSLISPVLQRLKFIYRVNDFFAI
jgi:ABC-type polysaccharide/polyol phosphate export permease